MTYSNRLPATGQLENKGIVDEKSCLIDEAGHADAVQNGSNAEHAGSHEH